MANYTEDKVLDARGLLCPMPVIKAAKEMRSMVEGEILKILSSDRGAIADFPAWADDTGNDLLESGEEEDGSLVFYIRKGEED